MKLYFNCNFFNSHTTRLLRGALSGRQGAEGGGGIQWSSMVGCTGTMKASAEGKKTAGEEVCAAAVVQGGKYDNERLVIHFFAQSSLHVIN